LLRVLLASLVSPWSLLLLPSAGCGSAKSNAAPRSSHGMTTTSKRPLAWLTIRWCVCYLFSGIGFV
jgi:hypothetical protein